MSEAFNLLKRVRSLEVSPELSGYSGVRIYAGQDDEGNSIEYFAGNETGKVLEITNDWGTQAQADAISKKILGYRYQPYTATGSQIDPSVELGDAVTVSDTYGGVFSRRSIYGKHVTSDVSAPFYDEIEHEFQIQSPTNRQYDRFTRQMRASLSITNSKILAEVEERKSAVEQLTAQLQVQAGLIEAKVSKTGGDASSFAWEMTNTFMLWKANGTKIFNLDKNGAEVYGKIVARSGKIGGFDILSNYLSYNNQTWGGTNSTGIYAGPQGIQCGSAQSGIQLTNNGYLYAERGEFRGSVRAKKIEYGGDDGYFDGGGISSGSIYGNRMVANTISTAYTSSGINSSLGRADYSYNVCTGVTTAEKIFANEIQSNGRLSGNTLFVGGYGVKTKSVSFKDQDGNTVNINYWGWS